MPTKPTLALVLDAAESAALSASAAESKADWIMSRLDRIEGLLDLICDALDIE